MPCIALLSLTSGCTPNAAIPPASSPRIASLAPNLTEIAYAVGAGDALIGRTDVCDYPPECKALPVIGNFGRAFPEALAATRANVVMCIEFEDMAMLEAIKQLGIRHELIPCKRLADIPTAIMRVGALAGCDEKAAELSASIADGIAEWWGKAESVDTDDKPVVFLEMWDSPLITAGRDSFMSEVVALAGGRNLGDELTERDYASVSEELVLARNPDVIICLYGCDNESARKRIASRVGWSGVKAVKENRIYAEFDLDVVCRPGPRVVQGIESIAALIGRPENPD